MSGTPADLRTSLRSYADEPLLVTQFRAFYSECVRLKEHVLVSGSSAEFLGQDTPDTAILSVDTLSAAEVRQQLINVMGEFRRSPGQQGRAADDDVANDARYAMAALGDEVFLNLDWNGAEYWASNLLETHFFRTHSAGDVLFRKIGQLIARPDASRADLAWIYLMVLGLDFQGKFRDAPNGDRPLRAYRDKLREVIASWQPSLSDSSRRLLPEAYRRAETVGGARLPYLRRWALAFALLVIFWTLFSHVVWRSMTTDLSATIARVLS